MITDSEIDELLVRLQLLAAVMLDPRPRSDVQGAIEVLKSLKAERAWKPIDTAEGNGPYQLFWPAYKLNDEGETTDEIIPDRYIIGSSDRISEEHMWEEPDSVNAVGGWFNDNFEYGKPTHYRALPPPPIQAEKDEEIEKVEG